MAENDTGLPTVDEAPADVAPQPAPEPAEKPETEKVERVVPLAELQRERERRKEVEQRTAKLEERLTQLFERANRPPEPKPEPVPDFQSDPATHLKANLDQTRAEQRQIMEELRRRNEAERFQEARNQFISRYAAAASEFADENPDFRDAYTHLAKSRDEELRILGWDDPQERQRRIEAEEHQIVMQAFNAGVNPAERLYAFAKHRGYRGPAANDADKLDTIAAGQKSAKSLTAAGGSAPAGRVTAAQLIEMSDEEFAAATKGDRWRKLMGG